MIPVKTPGIIKKMYPKYIWDFHKNEEKKIYLTFDDGPIPEVTEFVLEQLQQYHAKATFFCIGDNVKKHPVIFNQIIREEHAIGNHTMNHLKAWKTQNQQYIQNLLDCEYEILKHTSYPQSQKLFRPPYGQISIHKFREITKLGYNIILWDVLSKDWQQQITHKKCIKNVVHNGKPGSIIVFHDSIKAYKNLKVTLPETLRYFTEKGFTFDKITF